ncbi:TrkH family potassium uptake protein [Desulfovibrio inopinatus]|uniref:TrkH family potassium uptake protein n=1 Tax=Desulfovibrio inopinatus TaxID=102109 RepID=UPI000414EC66|nr:potassium transporter TrkG [Desulfovibrio inopinatus]
MRWKYVFHVIGVLIAAIGLCMLPALGFSVYYNDAGLTPLLMSTVTSLFAGGLLFLVFFPRGEKVAQLNHREGMAITTLGWTAATVVGALPFFFGDIFPNVTDCLFESISGFSTTGASVLTDIEAVPRGILFWRSLTHFLGGMGIIVLSIAILPFLGVGGMQLYKAEVPGPIPDKLKPRIKDTAMVLWKVYILFSIIETILLMFGGMDVFDALCHTFGTMATGGFSTKNASVAAFDSSYIDWVITFFMLVAGINFALHYQMIKGRPMALWKDPECRSFLLLFGIVTLIIIVAVYGVNYDSVNSSARFGAFQVASILTTTGYATADYELWPPITQCLLLFCMFLGGCAGSTGGGMKIMRIMLLLKHCSQELVRVIHPRAVVRVKFGGKVVPAEVMHGVWGFTVLWLGLLFVTSFLVAGTGVDVVTSFASVLACIGNIGPGIGNVGPTENYAGIPGLAKWGLMLCMLLGRLEIYTVIILFVPGFYKK